jgi:hypothetical protein
MRASCPPIGRGRVFADVIKWMSASYPENLGRLKRNLRQLLNRVRGVMPLDDFQKRVIGILMPLRSPDSTFAGGAVLQRHGLRMSDDQDLFHPDHADIASVAERDIAALESAGFGCRRRSPARRSFRGHHIQRGRGQHPHSAGAIGYLEFLPTGTGRDDMFGWRLHMADLAINKALAASGRRQVRDYSDLALIYRHMIPLWHVCWAAPGKDESWSPMSLVEKIAATNGFRQADFDANLSSTVPLKAAEVVRTVREAIEQARGIRHLPADDAGKLFVDDKGGVVIRRHERAAMGPAAA